MCPLSRAQHPILKMCSLLAAPIFYGGVGRAPSAQSFFRFFLSSPPAAPHEFFQNFAKEREELTQINTQRGKACEARAARRCGFSWVPLFL